VANLILNPSFEVDTNADGLADNWTLTKTVSGTPTTSRVAGLFGSYAQRIAYTSSSDSGKNMGIFCDTTAVGSVAEGAGLSGGVWVRVAGAITYIATATYVYNASGGYLSNNPFALYLPSDTWRWIPAAYFGIATASRARLYVIANGIDTGDSVTLDVDGVYLSPDANFDYYGKYPVIGGAL